MTRTVNVAIEVKVDIHDKARTATSCGAGPTPWNDTMAMRWRVQGSFPTATGQFFAHGFGPEERHAL